MTEQTVSSAIALKKKMDNIVKANVKKKQDKRHKVLNPSILLVGQKVLRKNIRTQQRKGGKLERTWLGPFTITSIVNKSADLVNEVGKVFPKINTDHLKPFIEPQPRIPHRIRTQPTDAPPNKKTRLSSSEQSPPHTQIISPEDSQSPSPPTTPFDLSAAPPHHCDSPIDLTTKPQPQPVPFTPLSPVDLSLPKTSSHLSHLSPSPTAETRSTELEPEPVQDSQS
ncbi:hypothetical protein AALO_G00099990 [Alosa alosa]|uniref:Uncharacterized protein n=1 Tax=Alosa alosa TaxID=278164 RepID=A0AAV6GZR9_9TELE|nr:hypothetical protein AALO_G00099990 [Alosa alosa]